MTQEIISNLIFSIKKLVYLNIFDFPNFDFVYKEYVVSSDTSISLERKKKYFLKTSTEPQLPIYFIQYSI